MLKHYLSVLLLLIAVRTLRSEPVFRPESAAIHSTEALTAANVKWMNPIYNLAGWKRADGSVERDILKAGGVIALTAKATALCNASRSISPHMRRFSCASRMTPATTSCATSPAAP